MTKFDSAIDAIEEAQACANMDKRDYYILLDQDSKPPLIVDYDNPKGLVVLEKISPEKKESKYGKH